ncbi:FAD/NAD(P)-binding domain-containing protein [Aspergillus candidus]|uniref:FAD/NAD(P)-binding domain-containing protein n=1 Tax=Aspergillus candidus TaxID=41067 RepID=A0A2I2FI14_ASPCN|nr:FAD/NAD(P)-binding domain-containing protein [Aspergillus candidus]PLB40271.1 FAD/NAD(P)-binding domain-containing protein [Aspergillus candidus]
MSTVHQNFDVVVVGGGNAALCAALSAYEAGATVAILEAAPNEERGGNSRFATAVFRVVHEGRSDLEPLLTPSAKATLQRQCRLGPYTKEMYKADMMRTSKGFSDWEQVDVVLDHSLDTAKWMHGLGVEWQLSISKFFDEERIKDQTTDLPAGSAMMAAHEGVGLTNKLWAAVERTRIRVFYDSPAFDLIADGDTVRGVRTRQNDHFVDFRGQVILACGGFEASSRLRRQFLGEGWDLVLVRGTRFNTGTMMEKALAAGALDTGHWGGCHASPQDFDAPRVGDLKVKDSMSRYSWVYGIMVNQDGKRFLDEGENMVAVTYAKTGALIGKQPNATAFQVFDQKILHLLEPRYETGTPIVAETFEELAEKMGIEKRQFLNTMDQYNAATPKGEFSPFILDGLSTGDQLEFPKSNWAVPLDRPPFVAYKVTCGITFTYAGLKTDTSARVLNKESKIMPGLFAVGEISGGFFSFNYPGGAGLVKGAVFGRIAGQLAAQKAREIPFISVL